MGISGLTNVVNLSAKENVAHQTPPAEVEVPATVFEEGLMGLKPN